MRQQPGRSIAVSAGGPSRPTERINTEESQCDDGSRTRSYVLGARESRAQGEGARQGETESAKHWPYTRRRVKVSTQLAQIAQLDRKVRFTSLAHLLIPEFLRETWGMINRHGADVGGRHYHDRAAVGEQHSLE
jgi:hypothetical protein